MQIKNRHLSITKIFLIFLLVLSTPQVFAQNAPLESVLLMPSKVLLKDADNKRTMIDEYILSRLNRRAPPKLRILGPSDFVSMIGYDKARVAMGCKDDSCLVEIGQALGSSHLLHFVIGPTDAGYMISAKLIENEAMQVVFRASKFSEANDRAMFAAIDEVIDQLVVTMTKLRLNDRAQQQAEAAQKPTVSVVKRPKSNTREDAAPAPKGPTKNDLDQTHPAKDEKARHDKPASGTKPHQLAELDEAEKAPDQMDSGHIVRISGIVLSALLSVSGVATVVVMGYHAYDLDQQVDWQHNPDVLPGETRRAAAFEGLWSLGALGLGVVASVGGIVLAVLLARSGQDSEGKTQ